jgi:hypothetical protein
MSEFIRRRGLSLGLVILVMAATALSQSSISYTFSFGVLRAPLGLNLKALTGLSYVGRWSLVMLMTVLWLLGRKRSAYRVVIVVNGFATASLLTQTLFLLSVLGGLSARTVKEMLFDVVLMGASNILVFSVWYWIIDPPGIEKSEDESEPWAFLFPQRAQALPNYADWCPRYLDYLFVAFTTSFAFSPTDTLPLTRSAKMLMLLQASISVVTLTGIAGSAINILAGAASAPPG